MVDDVHSRGIASLVRTIIMEMVADPSKVKLDVTAEPGNSHVEIYIEVGEGDVGRVIGRKGRNIEAIRTIAGAAGSMKGCSVRVDVEE